MSSIAQRPDGRWRARYRDEDGKEHAKHFKRKVDAKQWLDEIGASQRMGTYVHPSAAKTKLEELVPAWLAAHSDWTPSTRARNESIVQRHILPRWGKRRLCDIRHETIQEWGASITLSGGSVRKIVGVLSGILDYAVRAKRLAVNPAGGVVLPRQSIKPRQYLRAGEVERLAAAAGSYGDVVLTLAYTGLRWGEMAAVRVSRVDQGRRRLLIEESVTDVNGVATWGSPKDRERRSVPYPPFLDDALAERLAGKGPEDLVFTAARGGVLSYRNARRDWFDKAVEVAGVGPLTPHELRHTAASLAVQAGASVLAVQRMLGHDKPSTTLDVYADLFDEDLDEVSRRLDAVRSGASADFLRTNVMSVPEERSA